MHYQWVRVGPDDTTSLVTIIDAGSSKFLGMKKPGIVDFLAGTELHYVVLTHSDKDHINYMSHILNFYAKKVPYIILVSGTIYIRNIYPVTMWILNKYDTVMVSRVVPKS